MKIMHVVEAFGAGIYSFLVELCNSLADQNEIVIVHSIRKETLKDFKKDFNDKIKFIHLDMCRGFDFFKNISSLHKLKKIINYENVDIIHLHSSKAGFIGRLACKQIGFNMNKVFYSPHGFSFLQNNEATFKRKLYFKLEKYAANLGGTIIGCSKSEAQEAEKLSARVVNIDNSINTDKIDEVIKDIKARNDTNNILIGTVGRISFQKNPKMFNDIAKELLNYNFVWIGDGALRNILTSKNIRITGWLNRKEVLKQILNIDIFIMTSLWEGLPIALLEAMYLKKFVVVSNVIGNKDVVIDKENGYISNNVEEYVKCIKLAAKNTEHREKISNSAHKHIKNYYMITQMAEKYRNLYCSD